MTNLLQETFRGTEFEVNLFGWKLNSICFYNNANFRKTDCLSANNREQFFVQILIVQGSLKSENSTLKNIILAPSLIKYRTEWVKILKIYFFMAIEGKK